MFISECKQNLTENSGELVSPNYPNRYPFNVHCVWNITSAKDKSVRIGFKSFGLAANHSVQILSKIYTNMSVGNHSYTNESGMDFGTYSGAEIPDDIIIADGAVQVSFSSEYDGGQGVDVGAGFQAVYEVIGKQ